ncbi:hypothetical protein Q1695_010494 [Nippostrongylus brasiliensis]|nr:hypothetical protein Q1695_010494 [Nippostrongylus brasiliensis]
MKLVLLILCPMVAAESFIYDHPVNPKLHPKELFPIQRSMRGFGKVRDLPPSGIVYLKRIKPIGDERRAVARGNATFVVDAEEPIPVRELTSSTEKNLQNIADDLVDESADRPSVQLDSEATVKSTTPRPSPSTTRRTAVTVTVTTPRKTTKETPTVRHLATVIRVHKSESKHEGSTAPKPKLNGLKISMAKTFKRPRELSAETEAHLNQLINELTAEEEERNQKKQINLKAKRVEIKPKAKLVPLNRSAHVHTGEIVRNPTRGKLVQLRDQVRGGARKAVDFDPWERVGQL